MNAVKQVVYARFLLTFIIVVQEDILFSYVLHVYSMHKTIHVFYSEATQTILYIRIFCLLETIKNNFLFM